MQDLTISLIQTSLSWENPEANLQHFGNMLLSIQETTDLIILPEMFNTGFTMNASSNAEEMEGMSMQWMVNAAHEKQCVICGSLIIRENGEYYNRLIWMKPDGEYEHYDKKHLFRMGDEHRHFSAGDKRLIVNLKGWKIMPMICYDLRFPVWSKNEFRDGAYAFDLLIYVANWPSIRSQAWTSLITGRAIENMAYAAGVNRIGEDGRGFEYNGRSMIASPDGNTLLEINPGEEAISTMILKANPMIQIRSKLGVGRDWDSFQLL